MRLHIFIVAALFLLPACAGEGVLPSIGDRMSTPQTLAVDSARNRLYINNSNYNVLYGDGSFHVVDISNPASPVRVSYLDVPSFSGALYLDPAGMLLYAANRQSSSNTDNVDNMFRINVDEASGSFLSRSDYASGGNPYGIACCDAQNRILVASWDGGVDYYDLDDNLAHGYLDLISVLSTGLTLSGQGAKRVAIIGTQALVTRDTGGVWVINLDELGVAGAYPIDYLIGDVYSPGGIVTDGTSVFIVDVGPDSSGNVINSLLVLDISSLTPRTDNTTTELVDKEDNGLLVANVNLIDVSPQEVVVSGTPATTAYVSHFGANVVSIVDLGSYTRTAIASVGINPFGMALYPAAAPTHLFVANTGSNNVSVVALSNNTAVATYP